MLPKRIAAAAVVFGVATGIALTGAEILIRVLGVASPPVAVTANEHTFAKNVGIFFPSSPRTDRRIPQLPHTVSINSLGFRGYDIDFAKANGEQRIVMIGDSFVWGDFVDDNQTLPAHLETRLASQCSNIKVLNLGVGGTTIDAHRVMIERSQALNPDLIILVFHDNDISDLRTPTYWEQIAENRAAKSKFPASLVYGIVRNTAMWSLVRRSLAIIRQPPPEAIQVSPEDSVQIERASEEMFRLQQEYIDRLREFVAYSKHHQLPVVLTAFPGHHSLTSYEGSTIAWFDSLAESESLAYVNIHRALAESTLGVDDIYLLPHDGHASSAGNRIGANAIAEFLLESDERDNICSSQSVFNRADSKEGPTEQ